MPMQVIEITLKGGAPEKRRQVFLDLVNSYEKPNFTKKIIIDEDKQTGFLLSPDLKLEIISRP